MAGNSTPLTFVSLFSGCGGLDLGFESSGFRGLAAYDIDPIAIETHNRNLKTHGRVCDLTNCQVNDIASPAVVLAGPPCQGFSTLGLRRLDDPRNALVIVGVQHALLLKPKVIVIENVSGILSGKHRQYWSEAEKLLRAAKYSFRTYKVSSSDFGVPQIRRRVVMVAWRGNRPFQPNFSPSESSSLTTALENVEGQKNHEPKMLVKGSADFKIAKRIGQHQKLCNVRAGERAIPTWEIPEVFGKTTKEEREVLHAIQRLRRQLRCRDSGDADPVSIRNVSKRCGKDVKVQIVSLCEKKYLRRIGQRFDLTHAFNGKYRRLAWDHLAPAVDTRFGEPRYFLHPEEHRGFSVREAARIQGFPDEFEFLGTRAAQFRMVGNAVPPPLAQQLAVAIRDQLL